MQLLQPQEEQNKILWLLYPILQQMCDSDSVINSERPGTESITHQHIHLARLVRMHTCKDESFLPVSLYRQWRLVVTAFTSSLSLYRQWRLVVTAFTSGSSRNGILPMILGQWNENLAFLTRAKYSQDPCVYCSVKNPSAIGDWREQAKQESSKLLDTYIEKSRLKQTSGCINWREQVKQESSKLLGA